MMDTEQQHPFKMLTTPDGYLAKIDEEMVPIMKALWRRNINTSWCCQGSDPDYEADYDDIPEWVGSRYIFDLEHDANIVFPTVFDADDFYRLVVANSSQGKLPLSWSLNPGPSLLVGSVCVRVPHNQLGWLLTAVDHDREAPPFDEVLRLLAT